MLFPSPSSEEILERLKTKEDAELEEVKRRAAKEAEKASQGSEVADPSADGAEAQQDKPTCGMDKETSGEAPSGETTATL